jgi:tRNA 2-thiouridine synthesizing protein A
VKEKLKSNLTRPIGVDGEFAVAEHSLDCSELRCPMPIVRISLAIKLLATGDRLRVQATDRAFRADIEAWTRRLGHRLVEFHDGPVQQAVIEKGLGSKT